MKSILKGVLCGLAVVATLALVVWINIKVNDWRVDRCRQAVIDELRDRGFFVEESFEHGEIKDL